MKLTIFLLALFSLDISASEIIIFKKKIENNPHCGTGITKIEINLQEKSFEYENGFGRCWVHENKYYGNFEYLNKHGQLDQIKHLKLENNGVYFGLLTMNSISNSAFLNRKGTPTGYSLEDQFIEFDRSYPSLENSHANRCFSDNQCSTNQRCLRCWGKEPCFTCVKK